MQKLYCYTDESGQDTKGKLFLVCCTIVLTAEKERVLENELIRIEESVGKEHKWNKTKEKIKIDYLERLLRLISLRGAVFIKCFSNTTQYLKKTTETITKSIRQIKDHRSYEAKIFIDALPKSQVRVVAANLRRRGIRVDKVRGLKDTQSAILRLSDAMVGLSRDYIKNNSYAKKYYPLFLRKEFIKEI